MDITDYLMGAGVIGFICLIILVIVFMFIAPIIVAVFIANAMGLTGIVWWAFVIVIWLIIGALISKAS